MPSSKQLLATLGLALLGIALILPMLPLPFLSANNRGREVIEISAGFSMPLDCMFCWANDEIVIDYPRTLRVNESDTVEVRLASSGPFHRGLHAHDEEESLGAGAESRLSEPLALTLSAPSLTITPSAKQEKPVGAPMPLLWRWTISPTKEGNQQALLDLEALSLAAYGSLEKGSRVLPYLSVAINGVENKGATFESLRSEILRIEVLTREGIRLQTFLLLQYSLAFIGSVLLYPAVATLVIRYFQKRRASKSSQIILP